MKDSLTKGVQKQLASALAEKDAAIAAMDSRIQDMKRLMNENRNAEQDQAMWVARQDEKQREQFTTMKAQLDHTLEVYQAELADQLKYIRN